VLWSTSLNIRSLLALGPVDDFEFDLLAFLQAPETGSLDCREVCEQVFAAIIRRDEPVTLSVIEPLDGTRSHKLPSSKYPDACDIR
jgi:hypothetical protein